MTAVAKAVHRGADGSVHYLMSTRDGSLLVIADPALGVRRISFDGPVRLVPQDSKSDAVHYESISATGSTRVAVWPGEEPAISDYGFCVYCAFPAPGRVGAGHDSELWPSCPSHGRAKPAPAHEPEPELRPAASSSTGTAGEPAESSKGKPRVRVLDASLRPAPEPEMAPVPTLEPLTGAEAREAASRWVRPMALTGSKRNGS
jgi:hypothetical protein